MQENTHMELGLDFSENTVLAIGVINQVLSDFEAFDIFSNSEVRINHETLLDNYLQFKLYRNDRHVPLYFEIMGGDIRVDIDRTSETSEWRIEQLKNDREEIIDFLKELLTSYVLVEYYGPRHTRISLFGQDGKCTDSFKYQDGFSFKGKREDRLYFPIYPTLL